MSSDIQQKNKDKKHTISIAITHLILLTFGSLAISLDSTAFAQDNQTTTGASSSSPNQTGAQVTDPPKTAVLNKTTIPAQQTNVTVNQTTKPVSQQALQPLENLTQSQAATNLS
jgi:membrane protein involved in colicin uptake